MNRIGGNRGCEAFLVFVVCLFLNVFPYASPLFSLSVFHIFSLIVKPLCGVHHDWVRGIGLKWSSSDCQEFSYEKSAGHETVPPTSRAGSIPSVHNLELVSSHLVITGNHRFVGCGVRHPKHRIQNSRQLNPQAINWPSVRFPGRKPGGSENRCHPGLET